MATFSVSLEFIVTAKDHDKAQALADRIGAYVVQEDMAKDVNMIDVELLDDDEESDPIDDYAEDDE